MADGPSGKRARSDSTGSDHGHKRQVIQDPNGNRGYAGVAYDVNYGSATLTAPPASAGLPQVPISAESAAQPPPDLRPAIPPISIRALIVTQDASVIIGRGGSHIREIREKSGAKVDVTPQVPGNPERILNVTGPLDAVSKAFGLVVRRINDEPYDSPSVPGSRAVTVRFIIPNARMGSVIGKAGSKIKEIQEASGARLQASEAMLPGSTERVLTVSGVADAVHIAVYYVGTILQEYTDRAMDNRQYRPGAREAMPADPYARERDPYDRQAAYDRRDDRRMPPAYAPVGGGMPPGYSSAAMGNQTQHIYIPDELVASVIGKGGQKINEIRSKSATHIKILELTEMVEQNVQGQPGERLVTITGQPNSIQAAVAMLFARLEEEKQKQMMSMPRY